MLGLGGVAKGKMGGNTPFKETEGSRKETRKGRMSSFKGEKDSSI